MKEVRIYRESELTEELALPLSRLAAKSFANSQRTLEQRVEEILGFIGSQDPEVLTARRFVIWQDGVPVAQARTFVREVHAEDRSLPVLALATVCADPDLRGQGLGAAVTRLAFEQVGTDDWPKVSLFQTGVPGFYEKLNCRTVSNQFINRKNLEDPLANPWRDEIVMIYPGDHDWPGGVIDMNGPDY